MQDKNILRDITVNSKKYAVNKHKNDMLTAA